MNELQLTVVKAYPKDAGRGMARLDPYVLQMLQLSPGDIIEIEGRRVTGAKVWRADRQDWGQETIRIDSYVRQNAGSGIGERVEIRRAPVKDAERVVFAPPQGSEVQFGPDADTIVKQQTFKRPLLLGDITPILTTPSPFGGQMLPLIVTETVPEGMVLVDKQTEIVLLEKPVIGFDSAKGTGITYEDIGGLHDEVERVREMIELPMKHPEVFQKLGIDPPKGILMYGPPGTGKTLIAKAVANESGAYFLYIGGPEIIGKYYGESEQRLRDIFEEAEEKSPSIIFIDEIDSIAPKREDVYGEVERRVVAQLLSLMDGLEERGQVAVIAATNRVNAIDPALRRPGRFDREVEIGVPDLEDRIEILQIHVRGMPFSKYLFSWDDVPGNDNERLLRYLTDDREIDWTEGAEIRKSDDDKTIRIVKDENSVEIMIDEKEEKATLKISDGEIRDLNVKKENGELNIYLSGDVDVSEIAENTHGFVGADLSSLTRESAMKALRRYLPEINLDDEEIPKEVLDGMIVTGGDFEDALREIEPSAMREVLVEIPHVTWADVGGMDAVRRELQEVIEWPLKNPERFKKMGITPPKGILLYGPPGTGKTLLAKAAANESNANFISVNGPQLLSKWLGESEKAIRETFKKAKQVAPAIIFFDELDALAPLRGMDSSRTTDRVLNQLLTELDGLQTLKEVVVVAATNRPDIVDPALIRSGRFDRLVYAGVPTKSGREAILRIHTREMPLSLFSWGNVPGKDSKRLIRYLWDDLGVGWAEGAEIRKSDDGKTIYIVKDENSAKITIDKNAEKATLKIGEGRTCDLKVKKDGGEIEVSDLDLVKLSDLTNGYVGSDLETLCRESAMLAMREGRYLFSWDDVLGKDSKRLLWYLNNDLDIKWADTAKIQKSDDGKTIYIVKGENSAEITIDKDAEKATLKIGEGRTCDLKVKNENGKLIIYGDLDRIEMRHFEEAIQKIRPTANTDITDHYQRVQEMFKGGVPAKEPSSYVGYR